MRTLLPTPAPLPWRTAVRTVEKHTATSGASCVRDLIRTTALSIIAGEDAERVVALGQVA